MIKIQGKTKLEGKTIFDGSPAAFTPTSIADLQLWLDASDTSTLYDATVGGFFFAGQVELIGNVLRLLILP